MTLAREDLTRFLSELLAPDNYQDYGPNGLQIEGTQSIAKIAFAVSATVHSAQATVAHGAQALIVHHGLFWRFHGPRPLTGPFARRVFPLVRHQINLYGYHLPLDGHLEIGNAATLAKKIGLQNLAPFGEYQGATIGVQGGFSRPVTAKALQKQLRQILDHTVILASPDPNAPIHSLGIITGGANSQWREALAAGLDAYVTGEISEHDWHESQEAGIHMFAGGHHATEQFGIQALMARIADTFDVDCVYISCDNPA